jgi:inner membrane protein
LPTVISHAAVPLALGLGLGQRRIPAAVIGAGIVASMLPDLDVIGLRLGIPYDAGLGHRGASHSLLAAALVGLLGAAASRWLQATPGWAFLFTFLAAASHGVLDAFTDGGRGVALLWPLSEERFFAPFRPIEVSPIGITSIFSARGLSVVASEALCIWLPCAMLFLALRLLGRERETARATDHVNGSGRLS